ncbi:SGTB [Symbiodinium sp. KB8]|nr:SGTB [Symbiodinium sp. KB8]
MTGAPTAAEGYASGPPKVGPEAAEVKRLCEERVATWKSDGNARLTEGDVSGAVECYSRGIDAAKEAGVEGKLLSQLYLNRAQAQARIGKQAEALQDSEFALEHDQLNGRAYWRAATAALGLNRPDTAAALCMRGIKVLGDSDTLSSLLEEAKQKLEEAKRSQEDTQRAASSQVEAEEVEPTIASELSERAAALLRAYRDQDEAVRQFENIRRAVKLFQASLQEDSNNEEALLGLGEILDEGLGGLEPDPDAARVLWMQAATTGSQRAQLKMCIAGSTGKGLKVDMKTDARVRRKKHPSHLLFFHMEHYGLPAAALTFALSNASGLARVVASLGGYMIFTTGILLSDTLGYNIGSLEDAAAFIVFFDLGSVYTIWTLRAHINLRFLIAMWLPWTIFELIGTRVLIANSDSPWLKRSFGILLFVVLLVDAFEQHRRNRQASSSDADSSQKAQAFGQPTVVSGQENAAVPDAEVETGEAGERSRVLQKQPSPIGFDPARPRDLAKAIALGATGGLLKGMYTVPMPALTIFILFSGIDKDTWRANAVLNSAAGLPTKAYYLFVMEKKFDKRRVPQYIASVLGILCATPLGNFIARRINKDTFKDVVRALTFSGACSMLASGTFMAAWAVLIAFSCSCALTICRYRARLSGENQASGPPAPREDVRTVSL